MPTNNLLNRLETSADSPNSSTRTCGKIFHDFFLSVVRNGPESFSSKNKEYLRIAFDDWIQKEKFPTREDEEQSFEGLCLLVATLRRSISCMTDVPNLVHQVRCHFEGTPASSDMLVRFVETSHEGMMEELRVASIYALKHLDRAS